jgi:hypothetical protein
MAYQRSSGSGDIDGLKNLGKVLAKKIGFSALAWLVLYFIGHPMRSPEGILPLFSPVPGCLLGGAIGWWMAEDAVETAGFTGMALWSILVAAALLAILPVEFILKLITGWKLEMGGFMMIACAVTMALAASVWRASADN